MSGYPPEAPLLFFFPLNQETKKEEEEEHNSQVHDLVGRHARVGAADPEVARGLARRHLAEEVFVGRGAVRGPAAFFFWGGGCRGGKGF